MADAGYVSSLDYLLDLEAIRRLKHRYANLYDDNYAAEALADLFVEDGFLD